VIKAGATTLNIPDTTGWNLPHEFQASLHQITDQAAAPVAVLPV
jgi:isopropylmalate/homocitrate/citramalate synthase